LPLPKLRWRTASFTLEELAEIGRLPEAQFLSDGGDRQIRMHQQALRFQIDPRRDEGFGRHTHRGFHRTR
jgi:hypothetical protein